MKQKLSHDNEMGSPQQCLEKIKKLIDAQIDFNYVLADHLIKGSKPEICEIILSMLVDLSKAPKSVIIPNDEFINITKRIMVNYVIHDMTEFQLLKKCVDNNPDLDYLYLRTHVFLQETLKGVDETKEKNFNQLLANFYKGKDLKIAKKQKFRNYSKNNAGCAISADIIILNEILELLRPHVSDHCIKFKKELRIFMKGNMAMGYLEPNSEEKRFKRRIETFLSEVPKHPELYLLFDEYLTIDNIPGCSPRVIDNILKLFEKRKRKYLLKDQIEKIFLELQTNSSQENSDTPSNENKAVNTLESQLAETSQKESSIIIQINNGKNEESEPLVALDTAEIMIEEPTHVSSSTSPKTEKDDISYSSSQETETANETCWAEEQEEYSDHYRMFSKSNKKQTEKSTPKQNILNLNKEHQKTLLEVFDLLAYDCIKLRALVNLTQALGGTLKTTGANRCRIEIQNIYAHVLINEADLGEPPKNENICNKATVTMHGGGHRSTRSQNQDADKAPAYLINQFRAAFMRAGYTPKNLGLDLENDKAQISPK